MRGIFYQFKNILIYLWKTLIHLGQTSYYLLLIIHTISLSFTWKSTVAIVPYLVMPKRFFVPRLLLTKCKHNLLKYSWPLNNIINLSGTSVHQAVRAKSLHTGYRKLPFFLPKLDKNGGELNPAWHSLYSSSSSFWA